MRIGKVTSINYSQLKVKISSEIRGGSVNLQGNVYYFGNIGSYLKIKNAVNEIIICEVISIFDSDIHQEKLSFDVESNRELLLKPIGSINKNKKFTLGVGIFPALYSDVSIVTYDDMKIILGITEQEVNRIHNSFYLGTSKNLINYPININIDNFFNIHSAVLGSTGSGKSNTIAHIIQEIHKKQNYSAMGSRILVFDVNGEYKQALQSNNNISVKYCKPNIRENTDDYEPFYLPHFLLSLDEWSAFLLATDATQRPFWHKVLQESYRFYKIGNSSEEEEQIGLIQYMVNRVCEMVNSALAQADSDTSRITSAISIINKIEDIINKNKSLHSAINIKFNSDTLDLSFIEMKGKNVANSIKTINLTLAGVIDGLRTCSKMVYSNNDNTLAKAVSKIQQYIDYSIIQGITDKKLKDGMYFDYSFLKIAANMILLEEDARGNKQMRNWVSTMMIRLDYFLENPDCEFMRESENIKTAEGYLENFWGKNERKTQLIIIDTSELSPDILETLTSVVSRLLFDERRQLSGDKRIKKPIHLILDEAHRYIKKHHEYILKENIFEKIAREGRKFSFYLLVSSQRPSELSETVLSQCANFIIHRIQNERDMNYIQAILPYFSEDFSVKIKQSIPGEALVFGNCVSMPLHLKVHKSDPEPNSKNCKISEEWFQRQEQENENK